METLKCPECEVAGLERIFAHQTPVVARRALSLHRWNEHHVRSPKAIQEAQRKARLAAAAANEAPPSGSPGSPRAILDEDEITKRIGPAPPIGTKARASWMKARWRLQHTENVKAQRERYYAKKKSKKLPKIKASPEVTRVGLQQSAWWNVEYSAAEQRPIRLSQCPCCGAKFLAILASETSPEPKQ